MMLRALVTGADGFVGRFLCPYLEQSGWKVKSAITPTLEAAADELPCDITQPEAVARLMHWAGPVSHLFHLAALTFAPAVQKDPAAAMAVNLNGTIHLLDALRKFAPEARFIYIGSANAYGTPQTAPVTEEHPLQPDEPYAISKAAADLYCAYFHKATQMDVVRVRPFNHSGPGQSDQFVLPGFARQIAEIEARRAEPIMHVGDLEAARDFLHVRDVVRAYELVAREGISGEVYNVCSGRSYKIRELLDLLLAQSSVRIRVEVDPERLRNAGVRETVGSHAKLTEHTGWKPEIPVEALLDELLTYWREKANVV